MAERTLFWFIIGKRPLGYSGESNVFHNSHEIFSPSKYVRPINLRDSQSAFSSASNAAKFIYGTHYVIVETMWSSSCRISILSDFGLSFQNYSPRKYLRAINEGDSEWGFNSTSNGV
jgi:hypothetical protein